MGSIKLFHLITFSLLLSTCFAQSASTTQKSTWEMEAEEAYNFAKSNLYVQPDSIIKRFSKIETNVDLISNPTTKFNVFNILGIGHQIKSNYDTSTSYLNKAISIAQSIKDTSLILKSSHNKAINLRYQGNFNVALETFFNNLRVAKKSKNTKMIGFCLSEIANIYNSTQNWAKAVEYNRRALNHNLKNKNNRLIGTAYNSLAYTYLEFEGDSMDLDKGRALLDSAITYHELANNIYGLTNAKRQKCITYGIDNDFHRAIDCQKELLQLDIKIGNKEGQMIDLTNLGKNYTNIHHPKLANKHLLEALPLAKQLNKPRFVAAIYESLGINNKDLNSYKKAYHYLDSATTLNDSIVGIETQESIAELETKYQLSEKERQILEVQQKSEQLAQEKELANLTVKKRNNLILFIILLAFPIGIATYFYFQNNKKKQALKEAELLKEERQKALKAVIDAQEEERKRIAKDLHDSIGQKLSGIKMGWSRVVNESKDENVKDRIKDLSKTLESTADEIRAISHKMMPITLREIGISAALKSMLENTFQFSEMTYTYDESKVEGRFKEALEITIYRIAQELVNNAIKHAKAKEINVQLLKVKTNLILIVQDDGMGIDLNQFKKGHGYMNISSRLSVNSGEINLESTKNQGLFAQVKLKID